MTATATKPLRKIKGMAPYPNMFQMVCLEQTHSVSFIQ